MYVKLSTHPTGRTQIEDVSVQSAEKNVWI